MTEDRARPNALAADARYVVEALYVSRRGRRRLVGHTIRLLASHPRGATVLAGCGRCSQLWRSLRAIAEWALRGSADRARSAILPFDRCLRVHRDGRREIELAIEMRAKQHEEDEVRLLAEREAVDSLCAALEGLGVPRGAHHRP